MMKKIIAGLVGIILVLIAVIGILVFEAMTPKPVPLPPQLPHGFQPVIPFTAALDAYDNFVLQPRQAALSQPIFFREGDTFRIVLHTNLWWEDSFQVLKAVRVPGEKGNWETRSWGANLPITVKVDAPLPDEYWIEVRGKVDETGLYTLAVKNKFPDQTKHVSIAVYL